MTSERLGEMFEGDSADICAGKFLLVSIGAEWISTKKNVGDPPALLGRVNKRGNIIFLDLKKAHMFKCKIYMYRN